MRRSTRCGGLLGIAILCTVLPSQATVLIFEPAEDAQRVSSDYGDRVASTTQGGFLYGAAGGFTPNVTVDYSFEASLFQDEYGDLQNVLYQAESSPVLEIILTADPGFFVSLTSFDAGGFRGDFIVDSVQVLGSDGGALFSSFGATIEGDSTGPGHTEFGFASPLVDSVLTIRVDASSLFDGFPPGARTSDNIGLDNVQFSQVPEPSSAALLGVGLACGVLGRRLTSNRDQKET